MNRKSKRQPYDFYETPRYTIQSLLDVHKIEYPVLEPCAGTLAISRMLTEGDPYEVYTNDINPLASTQTHQDYLKTKIQANWMETIITNPPYSLAQEIIEKALKDVAEDGEVIMLLRLNFLGAQKRKKFWQNTPLKHIYVLSKRPCFLNKKSDMTEYAWFIWQKGYKGKASIEII